MNIITKIKCWLIKKLGGYPEEDYADVCCQRDVWKKLRDMGGNHLRIAESNIDYWCDKYNALEKTLRTVESYITIDNALGYTEGNVIAESRQQTYYQLGKAVYPYAHHILTSDGKYICAVNVQEDTE